MKETYHQWYSQYISREFRMLEFGHAGFPLILFPTSMGHYYENKDFKLIESARWFIEQGLVHIYCPDGMDKESWYNKSIHPADRVRTHNAYENVILYDIVHKVRHHTGVGKVAVAGCSFGGYHATNFAFRHPELVAYLFNMSAAYDIRSFMDGYYDDNVYFNNPVDFLPNAQHPDFYHMGIILGVGEHDICRAANEHLSGILSAKGINHWLDIRPGHHDWPLWREMFPHYLSKINFN
ncbi:MAG: abhydrolase domain-containing 18 [Bacteroidetes bacterium]|nr:MAG: abhydrolase domain-containing 18 [Bacteroidota bacterium]